MKNLILNNQTNHGENVHHGNQKNESHEVGPLQEVSDEVVQLTWSENVYFEESNDAMAHYLKSISKTKFMKAEEEKETFYRLKNGDKKAFHKFVSAYLRLVVWVAKRFKTAMYNIQALEFMDLIQEGNIGLLRAIKTFDPEEGRFTTYATWWIQQYISRGIMDLRFTVRVPVHMGEKVNKYKKLNTELTSKLGRSPTVDELAKEMRMGGGNMDLLRSVSSASYVTSIDQPFTITHSKEGTNEEGNSWSDLLPDKNPLATDTIDWKGARGVIRRKLKVLLTIRQYEIISLRFGLKDNKPMKLEEIGQMFGVSRERIRQIETIALSRLTEELDLANYAVEMGFRVPKEHIEELKKKKIQESLEFAGFNTMAPIETVLSSQLEENTVSIGELGEINRDAVVEIITKRNEERRERKLLVSEELREAFNVAQLTKIVFRYIKNPRHREVIIGRFGFGESGRTETLQFIGDELSITRERVRQIEADAIENLQQNQIVGNILNKVLTKLKEIVDELGGGFMPKRTLWECCGKDDFLIKHLMFFAVVGKKVQVIENSDDFRTCIVASNHELVPLIIASLHNLAIKLQDRPALEPIVLRMFSAILAQIGIPPHMITEKNMLLWLELSKTIVCNPLTGEWGRVEDWHIKPKTVSDYAYVVLSLSKKKPLHFEEIAQLIAEATDEELNIATVHNALIYDERFVLSGRGLYSLKVDGFDQRPIKDIVHDILKEAGTPLTKDEIVSKVLTRKVVKEASIVSTLSKFKKVNGSKVVRYSFA